MNIRKDFFHRNLFLIVVSIAFFYQGCTKTNQPPRAEVIETRLEKHGHVRVDPYYWLKERENPKVIDYLRAENQYTDVIMAPTKALQETLFTEFKTRIKQTDLSVPYKMDDYYYYTRVEGGKDYPIYCRKKGTLQGEEQVMLDANERAAGHGYYSVGQWAISSSQNLMAFSEDTVGRRFYDIRFKNLSSGKLLDDCIPQVTGNMAWANDNKTLFYTRQDPHTLRWYQIYRHVLGTPASKDALVFTEKDSTFSCGVRKSKSKRFLFIASHQTLSSEYQIMDADQPAGAFKLFTPRRRDHLYDIDHYGDYFYIVTNHEAKNFRLMKTPVSRTAQKFWQEVIPHRTDVLLEGIEIFKNQLVVVERKNGLIQLCIKPWSGDPMHYIDFEEPAYAAYPTNNYDFNTPLLRYSYSSLTTPHSIYDYDMDSRQKELLKRDEVLGGYDLNNYVSERHYAKTRDGVKVPISLVYRKGMTKDGSHPLLLYGYGSYGYSMDARFNPFRVSLLDRGFIYAIAHIRGGQEMGRWWYEDGKLLKKKNTFTDFIDCADYLVAQNYTSPEKLFAQGGSAGGLLMGAVLNMRPDLFKGALVAVPFVDVLTTMLDESIPLTTSEFDEWGNPNVKEYYDYILSYSPYDNLKARAYPNMLVLTSLHDSQVQYWEPAKYVARLRALKTDDNLLLLKTEMEAGHGGVSGRDKRYRETAFDYAFILKLAGIEK
ncbi:S9 family peptidase [candidate division KSB1 bacterium]|nr:S9 family peptidase [candidate division KSB1 bacterium]